MALALIVVGCTPAGPRALLDGKSLLDEGKYNLAVAKLKLATTLLSTNAQAWNYFGLACHRAGQLTNAVTAYQKALDLNRDLLEARYNLGCVWLDLDKAELAKAEFTSFTLRRGNAVEGWLKLGTAQLRNRELAAAEKSFREALRHRPNNPEALNGLGLVQLQRQRPREAVQYFAAALKQQPDYRPALLNLASVSQQSLNDRVVALEKYREYLALKPRPADWEVVNAVAQSLEQQLTTPARPAATNQLVNALPVARTNATRSATTNVAQTPAPKTNALPPPKKAESPQPAKTDSSPAVAKPVAPASSAHTAAVEIVTLPPEPVIRTASGTVTASTTSNTQTPVVQSTTTAIPSVASEDDSTPEKKSFLARVNPANLFRRESKTESNTGAIAGLTAKSDTLSTSNRTQTGTEAIPSPSPGTIPSSGQRYTYLSPAKPPAGNRREAERAFAQGQQAHRANRLAEAAQAFRQATQIDPGYFEAHYNLGLVAFESRSFRQSLTAWESALAIQPESVDARYNFALALKAANYPLDAANELKQILAANANETRAHLVLGNLFAGEFSNPSQARAHYLKVLEQDPRHPQATAIRYWLVAHPP